MPTKTPNITAQVMLVTPQLAYDWLERHEDNQSKLAASRGVENISRGNRALRDRHIASLGNAMLRGEWKLNGDAIRFDSKGNILDGQHRLWAVIQTGISISTIVMEGLLPDSQMTMDLGARRNLKDTLRLKGETKDVQLAATLTYFWRYQQGQVRNLGAKPSIAQALELLETHPAIRDALPTATRVGRKFHLSQGMLGTCFYELETIDTEGAEEFFDKLFVGASLDPTNAIFVLRSYLERVSAHGRANVSGFYAHAHIIKGWNAWREKRSPKTLVWKANGMYAEAFPTPVN